MAEHKYMDSKLWDNPSFPNRIKDNEDIIFIVREDLVFVLLRFLVFFFIFIVILIAKSLLAGWLNDFAANLADSAFYVANIILLTSLTYHFHNYYLSLQIVTTERIIDIDQLGLFLREVNELPMDNIEDVTYKQNGFWGTVFNFGNVIVQTASTSSTSGNTNEDSINGFVFNNVPFPSEISHNIGSLRQKNKEEQMKEHAVYSAQAMNSHYKQ